MTKLIQPTCLKTFERDSPLVEATFDNRLRAAGYTVEAGQPLRHECYRDAGHRGVCMCVCGVGDWPPLDAYTPPDRETEQILNDERASIEAGQWDRAAVQGENLAP